MLSLVHHVNLLYTIVVLLGGCACEEWGLRCGGEAQKSIQKVTPPGYEEEIVPTFKKLHKQLETKVTQCRRVENPATTTNNNNRIKDLSILSKTESSDSSDSVKEIDFGKCLLETTPWVPKWMNYSEDFQGFKIVPAEDDWCKPDNGTLEVLGDMKLGLNETNTSNFSLHKNGSLTRIAGNGEEEYFESVEFCVIPLSNGGLRFKRCVPRCPRGKKCIRKCCPTGEVLAETHEEDIKCVPSNLPWSPRFYKKANELLGTPPSSDEEFSEDNYVTIFGRPSCETREYFVQSDVDNKYPNLLINGTLLVITFSSPSKIFISKIIAIESTEFCIDGFGGIKNPGANETRKQAAYSGSEWAQMVIVCSPPKLDVPSWIYTVYAVFNLTAALFLFITAVIYVILWSHQNIHGWLQFAHAVSLLFAYSIMAIAQIWSQEIYEYSEPLCAYLGCLIQFTFLSAFFWLTSVNFDVWWRFSGRRSLRRIRSKPFNERIKRFLCFAVISVGFPAIISGVTMTLDILYKHHADDFPFPLPKFGTQTCYFQDKPSQFPYLYGPIGFLLFINLMFFSSTVVHLRKIHHNTELARSRSTVEDKKGVKLIAKLFVVMGVLWIFEFISWASSVFFPSSQKLLIYVFLPTDILNSLQGVAIFIIFVCKPDIWNKLKMKATCILPKTSSVSVSTVYYGK